jgi:glycosyltransferase involved in cell wall biosynthesis
MAYNAQSTISRTIESILNQTCGDFQYYVLDNGSTDDTVDIITDFAKLDNRIKPLHINKNDPANGVAIWSALIYASSAKYAAICDADDEYSPDFLENMIGFAEENKLDLAACGYEKIDGITNELVKHRALDENLVIYGNSFANEFIKYRGFTFATWGKLYSVSFLKPIVHSVWFPIRELFFCTDTIIMLHLFEKAERVGIYGKAMYKYYLYPNSLVNTNVENNITYYRHLWDATKKYLDSYGPISKINEDFLYAIHLSIVDEAINRVFASTLATDVKLSCLFTIFSDPTWAKTLTRDADPQFRNLAARHDYISDVKSRILALPGAVNYATVTADIFRYLTLT